MHHRHKPTNPEARPFWRRRTVRVAGVVVVMAVVTFSCRSGSDTSSNEQSGGAGKGSTGSAAPNLPVCPVEALAQATAPVEVTVWHFFAAKTKDTLEKLAAQYNSSQSKVHVNIENQGTSNDEVWKKYTADIKSKDLPAVAILDDTVTRQVIDSGTVLPAQSCINADHYDMSDFMKTAQEYYTVGDVLYPGSLNLSGALLYYNKNHFRRAGLDPEKTPQTLAEVRTYAEKIKAAGVVDKPVVLNLGPPIIEMLLTGTHVPIVNNDDGRGTGTTDAAAFDDPRTVELYRWIDDMVHDGLLEALPNTSGQVNHYLAMANQQASMTIETSTAATSVEAFLGGNLDTASAGVDAKNVDLHALDFGAAEVPGLEAPGRLQMGGGAWYMTNTGAPEVQAAAWDFLKFMNSLDSQVTWNVEGSYLPYRNSAVDDPRVQAKWHDTLAGRWLAIAYGELTNGVDPNFPGPLIGPYDQFRQAIRASTDSMIFKGATPEQAVKDASKETTDALVRYEKGGF